MKPSCLLWYVICEFQGIPFRLVCKRARGCLLIVLPDYCETEEDVLKRGHEATVTLTTCYVRRASAQLKFGGGNLCTEQATLFHCVTFSFICDSVHSATDQPLKLLLDQKFKGYYGKTSDKQRDMGRTVDHCSSQLVVPRCSPGGWIWPHRAAVSLKQAKSWKGISFKWFTSYFCCLWTFNTIRKHILR